MMPLVLAAYAVFAPAVFLALLGAARFIGAKLSSGEFSWVRYGAWLATALVGGLLLLAARTTVVFLAVSVILVAWVLLRAAADAQSTTLREKVGFIQLYAGLSLVEYGALDRAGALDGIHASRSFTFALHDYLGHLLLPIPSLLVGLMPAPSWAQPGAIAGAVATVLAGHFLLAAALSTFAVTAFAYAYFAEHTTPEVGIALLPAPSLVALLFAGISVLAAVLPERSVVGFGASLIALFLTPFFAAEGVWVVHRLLGRLRTRTLVSTFIAGAAVIVPALAVGLAALGWAFDLVRVRAFEPILGDVKRSESRPRLRSAFTASVVAAALLALLALADRRVLRRASPMIEESSHACAATTLVPSSGSVLISGPGAHYSIDADETPLQAPSVEAARGACQARGERLCTSDEWYRACVCTYPDESLGGPKIFSNDKMVYRQDGDRAGAPEDVRGLLSGKSEIVAPDVRGGATLLAGANDTVDDGWTADCRYRALVTARAFEGDAAKVIAARCCR